jgi:hypothetical protein
MFGYRQFGIRLCNDPRESSLQNSTNKNSDGDVANNLFQEYAATVVLPFLKSALSLVWPLEVHGPLFAKYRSGLYSVELDDGL